MGRKVHPVGFRLKVIRDWNARWYAEGGRYRDLLQEDMAIRRMIKHDLNSAGVAKVEICLLYTSPSPRDRTRSRMPSSA